MTDPVTALSAVASAAKAIDPDSKSVDLGVSLWGKVLGPPAEALGRHFERRVERWSESNQAKHVLKLAAAKSDTSRPGSVPPRVAAAVLDAAEYSDNEFVAEYLSGVLASARTTDGTDDRGVSWSALVDRLSSDALKLHYVIFSTMRHLMEGADADVISTWCKKHIVIRYLDLLPMMGLGINYEAIRRVLDAAYTLQREGMIDALTHGSEDHLTGLPWGLYQLPAGGDVLIVSTTVPGIQLYLQGHGYGGAWASAIADTDRTFDAAGKVDPALSKVAGHWLEELPRKAG
ncbi:hypothetical protein ACIQC0_02215 [Pseudarthrobacter sp. NPDC092419]|uniref:hypothetical protein n=1 Tax=Pseudarthrobacter sp. NPDC092419 TaxID=3364414 RepID=UPI00380F3373